MRWDMLIFITYAQDIFRKLQKFIFIPTICLIGVYKVNHEAYIFIVAICFSGVYKGDCVLHKVTTSSAYTQYKLFT